MTARVWPISLVRSWRLFAACVLIFAALLFSSQLALAQFTQQGPKLVGTDAVGQAAQGTSVALSADGNTAIVGGFGDDANGAAWVFIRSGGVWTQQGSKLVGTGAVGNAGQGLSVALSAAGAVGLALQGISAALSADGNTAIEVWRRRERGGVGLHPKRRCPDPTG